MNWILNWLVERFASPIEIENRVLVQDQDRENCYLA